MGDRLWPWDRDVLDRPEPKVPPLFQAVDGVRFWHEGINRKREAFVLRAGAYVDGNGAISIWTTSGECEDKLTVNIQPHPCEPGPYYGHDETRLTTRYRGDSDLDIGPEEFAVKMTDRGRPTDISWTILQLGLFEDAQRSPISQGFSRDYASIWRFARCMSHVNGMAVWEAKAKLSKLAVDAEVLRRYAQEGIPAVECVVCMERVKQLYEDEALRRTANETIDMLKNVRREDL